MIPTFRPGLRIAHTATSINNILYILGGTVPPDDTISPNKISLKSQQTFLYLNFSVPFNTDELEWLELSNDNMIPSHRYAAAIKGGANNNTLFLYGGESLSDEKMDLVYTFDTQNNTWSIPIITGSPPNGKVSITSIIDYNGKIYLFGGFSPELNLYTNDMLILDSINLSWKTVNLINAPSPRIEYGGVFLPNQSIIYMGGLALDSEAFKLNEVYLYDTINGIWTTKTTNGLIPSERFSFSSVLGLDGQRIIIYGGSGQNGQILSPEDSIYVLEINDFNWYIPKISGNFPSNRVSHKSVIIEKYMVITFGIGYTQEQESDILLLDISNNDEYIWTTSFNPLSLTTNNSNQSRSTLSLLSQYMIIGVCVIVGILISYYFMYIIYRNRPMYPNHNDQVDGGIRIESKRERQRETEDKNVTLVKKPNVELQNFIQEVSEEMENNLTSSSQYNDQVNNFNVDNKIMKELIINK